MRVNTQDLQLVVGNIYGCWPESDYREEEDEMAVHTVKLDYQTWLYYRKMVDRLREVDEGKYSWGNLSTLLGESERGYAQSAYKHRSILTREAITNLEEVMKENGVSLEQSEQDESRERSEKFMEAMNELMESHGAKHVQLRQELPTGSAITAFYKIRSGKQETVSPELLSDVQGILEQARSGELSFRDQSEAVTVIDPPMPEEPEEVAEPEIPQTIEQTQDALLSLSVQIGEQIRPIVAGLVKQRDSSPKMFKGAYDGKIEQVKRLPQVVADLLDDFE